MFAGPGPGTCPGTRRWRSNESLDNLSQSSRRLWPPLSRGRDVVVFFFVRVLRGTGAFDRRSGPGPGEREQNALRVRDEALSVLQKTPLLTELPCLEACLLVLL